MTDSSALNALSRRHLLALGGAAAAAAGLTACDDGSPPRRRLRRRPPSSELHSGYDGPKLSLAYWNGFTGGDGPRCRRWWRSSWSQQDPDQEQHGAVDRLLPAAPGRVEAGKGPDVEAMHLDQLATNAARRSIVPVDDLAEALGLSESDLRPRCGGRHLQGRPLRHPARRALARDVLQQRPLPKAGISEPPTDAAPRRGARQAEGRRHQSTVLDAEPWPAHLMFLSLLWQSGGQPYAEDGTEATFAAEAGDKALSWMREQVDKGYSPKDVDIDSQYTAFKNGKNSITWDGIWQINDLEEAGLPRHAPCPPSARKPAVWANSHNFFLTQPAAGGRRQAARGKDVHRMDDRAVGRWAGAGMIPARNSARTATAVTGRCRRHPRPGRQHAFPPRRCPGWRRAAEDPGGGGRHASWASSRRRPR